VSTTLYLVFREPGPSWVKGLATRKQPLWDEHAVYVEIHRSQWYVWKLKRPHRTEVVVLDKSNLGRALLLVTVAGAGVAVWFWSHTRKPAVSRAAPEIVGKDLDGKPMKLSDFRGKVVMLDFWGDW
jgi:hypothetical protein